ncbi:hypothetical protein GOP47_0026156 [Adiantum capillus-veneris]|uniref:Uncharacterized protein n=1 Tax=Adiantum capillus-veneris TaxID=13818 RepID=A0A9D4U1X7_ADICA|nr:hypothetical protein GOP47_0026156 [Adiantum capillus-veneris]
MCRTGLLRGWDARLPRFGGEQSSAQQISAARAWRLPPSLWKKQPQFFCVPIACDSGVFLGHRMLKVVLVATGLGGLGSCWFGGSIVHGSWRLHACGPRVQHEIGCGSSGVVSCLGGVPLHADARFGSFLGGSTKFS